MISSGESSVSLEDIYRITTEAEIIHYYLGISDIPCKINSPLRLDRSPSFGLFSPNGSRITWIDFSSGERGGIFDLLSRIWNTSFKESLNRLDIMILINLMGVHKSIPLNIQEILILK